MNNKIRRNIWLTLAILTLVAIVDRAVRVFNGSLEWWQLVSVIIIYAFCTRSTFAIAELSEKGICTVT